MLQGERSTVRIFTFYALFSNFLNVMQFFGNGKVENGIG